MKKLIVFLDIDGTLLNEKYKLTSEKIYEVINRCKDLGVLFCLNSNRAIDDMLPIYNQLSLNGLIIAENGALVKLENKETIITRQLDDINSLRKLLPEYLTDQIKDSLYLSLDTVSFLQKPIIEKNFPSILFLSNKFRKYSFSIHVKKIVNGLIEKDLELTNKCFKLISDLIKSKNLNLNVSKSEIFGNVLINPSDCDKGSTLKKIIDLKYAGYTTIMIGDDLQDKSVMSAVDFFYSVGNAESEVKANSDYVARNNFTAGVVEILLNKVLT